MKKSDAKAEKITGNGTRTQIIFRVPVKINDSWEISYAYGNTPVYVKSAFNQTEFQKIQKEIIDACEDK